ncbi:flagellar motor switch protein FliG [candidate division KSB1 bacterium]|nr:flagellar motor switch protein FliG [candidate division KSB1 bacterium]
MNEQNSDRLDQFTGMQKAAILMIQLGAEISAEVFKHFKDDLTEEMTKEIIKMRDVHPMISRLVTDEFYHMVLAQHYILEGGYVYAKQVLEMALGTAKAHEIISRVQGSMGLKGFNVLNDVDPNQLLTFIQKEHPQTIALVLSQINRKQAASIISELPPNIQSDVIYRIANMDQVSPDLIQEVEDVLESRVDFSSLGRKIGGVKAVAEVLNLVGQSTEKTILGGLAQKDAKMAEEIEKLMFIFEDILLLSDRSVQQVLGRVDNKEVAMAMKAASDEVKNKIFGNMSERASTMLKEELEFMGPVKLKDVEDAQQRIIETIRKMEEEGEIVIGGAGKGEEIVE